MLHLRIKQLSSALFLGVGCFVALPLQNAAAENIVLNTKFSAAFLGVGVGKIQQKITISGKNYNISGSAKSNSFVSVIAKMKASYSSRGKIIGTRLVPQSHASSYKNNKKKGRVSMSFASGNVQKVSIVPHKKPKPGTVPVLAAHMKSVIDPASALLFPVAAGDAEKGAKICGRTLPVFGGKTRMNLVFSYKSSQKAVVEGFKGRTYTCSVRYKPVSGFRPHKADVKFMRANRDMQVTMARIGKSNLYALFGFRIKTRKGTATGRAEVFAVQ